MALSSKHQDLVQLIGAWCCQQEDNAKFFVFADLESLGRQNLPPSVRGYRPDVAWISPQNKYRFIGEAKTRNDLLNQHTRGQLSAYLQQINSNQGTLVVAVPWGCERIAVSLLLSLEKKLKLREKRWVVISDAPVEEKPVIE